MSPGHTGYAVQQQQVFCPRFSAYTRCLVCFSITKAGVCGGSTRLDGSSNGLDATLTDGYTLKYQPPVLLLLLLLLTCARSTALLMLQIFPHLATPRTALKSHIFGVRFIQKKQNIFYFSSLFYFIPAVTGSSSCKI